MQHEAIPVNGAHGRYGALRHVGRVVTHSDETVAEEVPVALVYNGISHAVMMATPIDLEVFALGFALSEGIVEGMPDVFDIEAVCAAAEKVLARK